MAGLFDFGGLDPSQFNLSSPGGFSLDAGNYNLGGGGTGLDLGGGGGGGGGGFNWGDASKWLGPALDIGKFGLGAGLGISSQMANAKYQRQMQDYYKKQSESQAAYNKSVQDYLKQKAEWESGLMGQFGEVFGSFQEQMGAFQGTMQDIVNQEMQAASPLLQQSQQLIEPAVASLAKGEIPPLFEPILNQAKQRAYAAAKQQYESAGMDGNAAVAANSAQIDQQVSAMLIQQATAMLSGGVQLGQQGQGFLAGAGQTAAAGMTPIEAEFQAMMQSLSGLLGGFPSLAGGVAPPPPVA
jgi:hypothetical protein